MEFLIWGNSEEMRQKPFLWWTIFSEPVCPSLTHNPSNSRHIFFCFYHSQEHLSKIFISIKFYAKAIWCIINSRSFTVLALILIIFLSLTDHLPVLRTYFYSHYIKMIISSHNQHIYISLTARWFKESLCKSVHPFVLL